LNIEVISAAHQLSIVVEEADIESEDADNEGYEHFAAYSNGF
jgi:hypothetical protein